MTKEVTIGKKTVPMKASALTPYLFKNIFGEDLIQGVQALQKTAAKGTMDAVFIAKMAWIMAKEANKDIEPLEEWLDQFEIFDLYEAMPQIIELWGLNEKQNSTPRKK